ncbi:hypothetical protein SV7mr_18150 [Stieleria bergensis]|uniref:Uncharacterized protein n=1 Tax=Stieleria bergensis TaxID=2528025 RepID=A0A517ST57_9BACT|nr:hypothetical protein SV7mr_18150 [Planctomycetes bacterium SV_7m_r]
MTRARQNKPAFAVRGAACVMLYLVSQATSSHAVDPELNDKGEQIRDRYAETLETLSAEIAAALPTIDPQKQAAFEDARAKLAALKKPGDDAAGGAHKAYQESLATAEVAALASVRPLLADVQPILSSNSLDSKLVKVAILRHGTPAGLAEFAQQSDAHQALLNKLFADEELMLQMVQSGGANGGEFGEAMQVYTAILEASERARERGTIFHSLALGTALQQPWLEGNDPASINGPVFTDNKTTDGQVARYLHYEQAFLDEELDPAFEDFNAWECRFITNDPYSNEELTWARAMLRNFRPDHITNPDHSWRYVAMVKSDLPYCSTRHDDTLGLPQQEALALGGICGRRAFFGRFITRAFGIPARRSTQTGHAAMNLWTPDGWVTRLGAWWSMNWCGPWGGLDFYLDSRAREFESDYLQVLRAQWIADALDEEDVSLRQYGKGGGFWNGLAFYKKRTIVEDKAAAKVAADAELANLTEDEARLLGESDKILGADDEVKEIEIPAADKKIIVAEDGTITVPAVACAGPTNSTAKVLFLNSFDEGMQIHYQRMGDSRPEILRYYVEAPAAGKYTVSALVSTVSHEGNEVKYRINRRTIVDSKLPYTKGMWEQGKPEAIELREGRNSIQITFRQGNRGISIKALQFQPVK